MLPIPQNDINEFNKALFQSAVPEPLHNHYRKWLRYFLDFCRKYPPPDSKPEQIRLFIEKLKSKKQTPQQCIQATHAISLYFESQKWKNAHHSRPTDTKPTISTSPANPPKKVQKTTSTVTNSRISGNHEATVVESFPSFQAKRKNRYNEWRCLEKSQSPVWDHAIDMLAAEIKTRHYSRKTLKTYADWVRKFQHYLRDKPPQELSSVDVKKYLTYLAVQCRVASSTQNQAFNALLFLYRHVLKIDFGDQRVPGGSAAGNRGADFVKRLAPSLRAGTSHLTRLRAPAVIRPTACSHPSCSRVSAANIHYFISKPLD
jgi:hypothetical protein